MLYIYIYITIGKECSRDLPWDHRPIQPIQPLPRSPKECSRPEPEIRGECSVEQIPFGKHTKNYGKSPCLMGKSTISMAMFNSYVSLPERSCSQDFFRITLFEPPKLLLLLIAHPSFHPIYLWSTSRSVCIQGPSLQIGVPLNPLASQCSIHVMLQFWGVHLFETHHISSH